MWFRFLTLALVSLAVGCGGETPRQGIYGKITLDGEPVDTGVITFIPAKGTSGPVVGVEIVDGEYELGAGKGPVPGNFRVEIKAPKETDVEVVVVPGEDPGYETVETIPAQYNTQSTLEVHINEGGNEQDFALKSTDAQ